MRRGRWLLGMLVGAGLVLAPTPGVPRHTEALGATGTALTIGAAEDAGKQVDAVTAKAKMDLARLAGFRAVRMTETWAKGQVAPSSTDLTELKNASSAASLDGLRPMVSIFNNLSGNTPLSSTDRAQFAQFATAIVKALPAVTDFVIGNEPNNNLFWMPQFNADGSDAAATAYEALLAQTYDAIKSVRPGARIMGGALAPRGGDNASGTKPTHSPTTFIKDLGTAYRTSGRSTPIMDVFDMHVFEDNSSIPPSFDHLNSTTISVPDYGKLVSLLGQAFNGTRQAGSTLPIYYGEFGVESLIPPAKASLYTGTEPATTHPVDETTQGAYYVQAMKVAYCQPNVIGLTLFHVSDEPNLSGWQSGVDYADDSAKASLPTVRNGIGAAAAGSLTTCPDTTPPTVSLTAPANGSTVKGTVTLSATAADNVGVNRVEFLVNGTVVGYVAAPPYYVAAPPYSFSWKSGANGPTTLTARALDAVRNSASSSVTVTVSNPPTISSFTPLSGATGASVSITGTNLSGATAVAFNGAAASYTVNSATQITAIVPSGASTGPISVTTPAGTATSGSVFTVIG